jgi:hypothetical protein
MILPNRVAVIALAESLPPAKSVKTTPPVPKPGTMSPGAASTRFGTIERGAGSKQEKNNATSITRPIERGRAQQDFDLFDLIV